MARLSLLPISPANRPIRAIAANPSGQADASERGCRLFCATEAAGSRQRVRDRCLRLIGPGGLALTAVWLLKNWYRTAGAEDLIWILGPIATLTSWCTGLDFTFLADRGYFNAAHRILIAPACSGVNFLLIAFSMASFQGLLHLSDLRSSFAWLFAMAPAAFGLTICGNTARIVGSLACYRLDIHGGFLTPERVHRLLGVFLYYLLLVLLHRLLASILRRHAGEPPTGPNCLVALSPLFWYLGFSLGIPLIKRTQLDELFVEHALTVATVGILACVLLGIAVRCRTSQRP